METTQSKREQQDLRATFNRICQDEQFAFINQGNRPHLPIPNAREALREALLFVAEQLCFRLEWLSVYDEVADYLEQPQGRGLLLFGDCGRGKSLIVERAIPLLMNHYYGKIFKPTPAVEITDRTLPQHLGRRVLIIDDVGTEPARVYGEQRSPISVILDEAERSGRLLFMTTNLDMDTSRGRESLESRYGSRTYDRFISNCRIIEFRGDSLRQ